MVSFSSAWGAVTAAVLPLVATASYHWQTFSGTTHYLKRQTPGIFTTGRLTTRQLGYISEAGIASIVSITNFPSADSEYNGMEGEWPSTADEISILAKYGTPLTTLNLDLTADSYDAFASAVFSAPKPVLIHCEDGWKSSLFVELYMTKLGVSATEDIFNNSLTLGWDFQSDQSAVDLINTVTHQSAVVAAPSVELTLTNGEDSYASYYWTHRLVDDNWYTLGQVLESHVDAIKAAGFKTVISFRANGEATNRLSWEATTGPVPNGEFSDANGNYNVTAESVAFENAGISFYNLPVSGSEAYTKSQFDAYVPTFDLAAANGPVLVHCASGYRSSVYTLAYLAKADPDKRCLDWAVKQARRVGESLDILSADEKAINFWRSTLPCEN